MQSSRVLNEITLFASSNVRTIWKSPSSILQRRSGASWGIVTGGKELDTKTFREGKEGRKGEGKPEWEKEKKEEEKERVGFCPARTGLGLLPSTTARMYTRRTRRGEGGLPGTVRRSFAFAGT